MAFRALDFTKDVVCYRSHLPHWRQQSVTGFVTFRLADSVPKDKLDQWMDERDCWLKAHGLATPDSVEALPDSRRHEYHRRFTVRFHEWLDAGHGACVLRRAECARVVADSLRYFDEKRHALEAFAVMPNHVHVLVTPHEGVNLTELLHSWKSYTAHEINKLLVRRGTLWQKESYDHLVRSEEQFHHYRRYIRDNPVKAKLREGEFAWWDALGEPLAK
jgi:REP-associated tyrosine transposase